MRPSARGSRSIRYVDRAEGVMTKNDAGKLWVSKTTLRPQIEWIGDKRPTPQEIHDLHHKAHEACFIANSYPRRGGDRWLICSI